MKYFINATEGDDCYTCDCYEKHKANPDRFYCSFHNDYYDWDETEICNCWRNSLDD